MKRIYLTVMLITTVLSLNSQISVRADETYKVDNTGENIRDRDKQNPTAQDQSNRKSDIKTTARLRRAIMRTSGLSPDAQNIKIISENGSVILRGPVDTEREKMVIDDLARQCCGASFINEIEVKK